MLEATARPTHLARCLIQRRTVMTTRALFRLSGLSLFVGAVLAFVGKLGTALYTGDLASYVTNPVYVTLTAVGVVGGPFLLLGLIGTYASQFERYGKTGPIAMLLITVAGMIFGLFFGILALVFLPFVVSVAPDAIKSHPQGPPGIFPLVLVGALSWVVGTVLLGLPHVRRKVLPAWPGYLLIGGAVMEIVSFVIGSSNLMASLLSALSALLPFMAFAGLGYHLWSPAQTTPATAAGDVEGYRTAT
jgi:hypothetical protein